jgi:hypothetical protein
MSETSGLPVVVIGAGLFDDPEDGASGACCAPAPQLLSIGRPPAGA